MKWLRRKIINVRNETTAKFARQIANIIHKSAVSQFVDGKDEVAIAERNRSQFMNSYAEAYEKILTDKSETDVDPICANCSMKNIDSFCVLHEFDIPADPLVFGCLDFELIKDAPHFIYDQEIEPKPEDKAD